MLQKAVIFAEILKLPSRVVAPAKKVNPPDCAAAIKKVPMILHRIPRHHALGREFGRNGEMVRAIDPVERAKIRKNDIFFFGRLSAAVLYILFKTGAQPSL